MNKVCANCRRPYIRGDKYCRFCGAPMGTPIYINDNFAAIYGPPPIKRMHTCKNCGHSWETDEMIDNKKWCPMCGGEAPYVTKDVDRTWGVDLSKAEETEDIICDEWD